MNEHHRQPWNTIPLHHRLQLQQKLTPRQYDIYALRHVGCSYQTIADMLNISPRTVRTHLKRAHAIHTQIRNQEAA